MQIAVELIIFIAKAAACVFECLFVRGTSSGAFCSFRRSNFCVMVLGTNQEAGRWCEPTPCSFIDATRCGGDDTCPSFTAPVNSTHRRCYERKTPCEFLFTFVYSTNDRVTWGITWIMFKLLFQLVNIILQLLCSDRYSVIGFSIPTILAFNYWGLWEIGFIIQVAYRVTSLYTGKKFY